MPFWAATALLVAGCASTLEPRRVGALDEIERRIRFYSGKLEKSQQLYPVYVQLAAAYFDKTRETHDPRWLAHARRALDRSIAIMPTYDAFVTVARIANYAHRFDDAIRWGRRALPMTEGSEGTESVVVAILVEAHAALGQYDEARALLPKEGTRPADFRTGAALAGWLSSQGRYEEASRVYDAAAELARAEDAVKTTTWAEAMAAGALLDAGHPELVRARLDAARRGDPESLLVRLHEAEWLAAERRPAEALAIYEALLAQRPPDPEIHARAHKLARAIGDDRRARRHFKAAERGFRQALDAGEVYTLGSLAKLYSDAGVHLVEAAALTKRNLSYRRDREARELAAEVQNKLRGLRPAR